MPPSSPTVSAKYVYDERIYDERTDTYICVFNFSVYDSPIATHKVGV